MNNRKQLLCFAAFTALAALAGVARADDYSYPVVNFNDARSEERTEPMTCAQATQLAWFKHQMEQSDGGYGADVEVPAECQREALAKRDATLASIHASVSEAE